MAELQRKKRLRAGHRASTTRTITQTYDNLKGEELNVPKLRQQETTLKEKMATLKELDAAILDLLEDDEVEDEIEQADTCKERIQLALYDIEAVLKREVSSLTSPRPLNLPL